MCLHKQLKINALMNKQKMASKFSLELVKHLLKMSILIFWGFR